MSIMMSVFNLAMPGLHFLYPSIIIVAKAITNLSRGTEITCHIWVALCSTPTGVSITEVRPVIDEWIDNWMERRKDG